MGCDSFVTKAAAEVDAAAAADFAVHVGTEAVHACPNAAAATTAAAETKGEVWVGFQRQQLVRMFLTVVICGGWR